MFGSDRTITGKWRKLCYIISLCVQCPATVMANDSFFDTVNSICGKSVSLTGRLITLKKRISITFCCCCCIQVVYKSIYLCKIWIISLLKNSLTSVRARNSMLSRPFAADECFSSISYFIFLYSQFTVKKLNVGHNKNTEWKCFDFAKWRGDHLWRYRNKS